MQQLCQSKMLSKHPSKDPEKCHSCKLKMPMLCRTPCVWSVFIVGKSFHKQTNTKQTMKQKPPNLRAVIWRMSSTQVTKAVVFVESAHLGIKAALRNSISLHIFAECFCLPSLYFHRYTSCDSDCLFLIFFLSLAHVDSVLGWYL